MGDKQAVPDTIMGPRADKSGQTPPRVRMLLQCLSLVAVIVLCNTYLLRTDLVAALTVIPAYCWLAAGLLVALVTSTRRSKFLSTVHLAGWIAFAVFCVPETWSLTRGWLHGGGVSQNKPEAVWRVISFNTGQNPNQAVQELAQWQPDVVLLQEIPPVDVLQKVGRELFGKEFVLEVHHDVAILARGRLLRRLEAPSDPESSTKPDAADTRFVGLVVELEAGHPVQIASAHLSPPVVRLDYWTAACWQTQTAIRRRHRTELQDLAGALETGSEAPPVIAGGDLNAPAHDGCTVPLRSASLIDAFAAAGTGWGNTGSNRYPLHRVDQIWVSPHWEIVRCEAVPSAHSDHRLVVCDLRSPTSKRGNAAP